MKKYAVATREEVENFTTFDGNRMINRLHVKNIAEQMRNNINIFPPITVNEATKHIIDGQHRIEAFKMLYDEGSIPKDSKLDVMYIEIPKEDERLTTINANTHSKTWTLNDYVHSFAKNNEQYAKLEEWCQSHPLMYENKVSLGAKKTKGGYRYRFASAILKGKSCQNELKNGTFSLNEDELACGEVIYSEIERIFKLIGTNGKPSALEQLAIKWQAIRKFHKQEEWYKMFKTKKQRIARMNKDNGSDWEQIFNMINTEIDKLKNYEQK